jgi:hypothetical protein
VRRRCDHRQDGGGCDRELHCILLGKVRA